MLIALIFVPKKFPELNNTVIPPWLSLDKTPTTLSSEGKNPSNNVSTIFIGAPHIGLPDKSNCWT